MLRDFARALLRAQGLAARRIQPPGSHLRPIGDLVSVLEDVKKRGFDPRLIFDVGASDGAWTRLARSVFPDSSYVLFEPRRSLFEPLANYCKAAPKCRAIHAAAGSVEGTATLTDWGTGSTLIEVASGDAPQYPIPMTTLNAVVDQGGVPDLVKLDVEGFEIEALKGASNLLGATELFIIEVALFRFAERPMLHDVVAFMAARNYFVYDIAGLIRRPRDGALGLLDVCFVRGGGQLHNSTRWD